MGTGQAHRVALMAINPEFARQILSGTKKVEFRKRQLARDIDTVMIYETSPTQQIVGEFTTRSAVIDAPAQIWAKFARVGGISQADFSAYYDASATAVGINIESVRRYRRPVDLAELDPRPAIPQSFSYVSSRVRDQARDLQPSFVSTLREVVAGLAPSPQRQARTRDA